MDKEHTLSLLENLQALVNAINASNSTNAKIEVLKQFKNNELVCKALQYTYSPYKQFNLTSASCKKYVGQFEVEYIEDLFLLLDKLSNREITGNAAIAAVQRFYMLFPDYTDLILNIIDKDLKIRMNAKNINKAVPNLIPEFNVALCNVYADYKDKVDFERDNWLAARKLDGCRCIAVVDENGKCTCWSRQGKRLETLGKIEEEVSSLGFKNVVFDGECCIVDENGDEHFDWIMKEIKKKGHTIERPMYQVFDFLTKEEFESGKGKVNLCIRQEYLQKIFAKHYPYLNYMRMVEQTPVQSLEHFNQLFNEAKEKDWEGLVIRKNVPYEGKRSNNMLKVKAFSDAEYVVESVEFGPFRLIKEGKEVEEEVLTNFTITHKGNKVSVGSGLSLDERRYYHNHPEEIIGKTVTIQYFEETKNRDGQYSLRFPTLKTIYKDGRDL